MLIEAIIVIGKSEWKNAFSTDFLGNQEMPYAFLNGDKIWNK